ncbi:gephyrin-like molybdotransferase receptor GlpR [Corynebacterium sp. sy039]|uniref:divisome protein SepX/GlpR n=1 Tax=Corynebacterium sp. sy039 TaxID=2599641 RepID=UPI0011B5CDFF|nr:gephyrin-like molybdotransferase receptor GlpR [Corynebacterium sp. sy039]QDZ42252.1 hypothetical protein FQV43_03005 [Corynebacterium sp. sy039]
MSGTIAIGLIVVVWLFVLAPVLLRRQKPMNNQMDGIDETRVVYEGGRENRVAMGPRPRVSSADVHAWRSDDGTELVHVTAETSPVRPSDADTEEILIDDESSERMEHVFAAVKHKIIPERKPQDVIDGEVIDQDHSATDTQPQLVEQNMDTTDEVDELDDAWYEEDEAYVYDDAYLSPADLLHGEAISEESPESGTVVELDAQHSQDHIAEEDDLTAEELEFAVRRRGRGGWDPEADQQASASRFQRRKRTLLGLAGFFVLSLALALILGKTLWIFFGAVLVLSVVYLIALRRQVQAEQRLRHRRIMQLRRARLGVRNEHDEALGIPQRLRRPGAVVLEIDDESPDFVELDVIDIHEQQGGSYEYPDTYESDQAHRRVS